MNKRHFPDCAQQTTNKMAHHAHVICQDCGEPVTGWKHIYERGSSFSTRTHPVHVRQCEELLKTGEALAANGEFSKITGNILLVMRDVYAVHTRTKKCTKEERQREVEAGFLGARGPRPAAIASVEEAARFERQQEQEKIREGLEKLGKDQEKLREEQVKIREELEKLRERQEKEQEKLREELAKLQERQERQERAMDLMKQLQEVMGHEVYRS
jgi:hypothetical protein